MKQLMLLIGICFLFTGAAIAEDPGVGRYASVEGRVDVLRAGGAKPVRIEEKSLVLPGDIVRTKSNSKVEIVFNDDSVLRIAPNSRIAVNEYLFDDIGRRRTASVELFRGKMRTIVSKKGGPSDFHITTPSAR